MKVHPIASALKALQREPNDVEHVIYDAKTGHIELFFRAPAPVDPAPETVQAAPAYLLHGDSIKPADKGEAPIEAFDLLQ